MTDRTPARTNKGRDVLLDRNIELDTKLRTVLAQCDGKRDADQIKARFGTIVDVDAALIALRDLGLIEDAVVSHGPVVPPSASVLETVLGAGAVSRVAAAASAPMVAPAKVAVALPVVAAVLPVPAPVPAPVPEPPVVASPVVAPVVEPTAVEEVDDDPFAEWFPASMRKSKDQAA